MMPILVTIGPLSLQAWGTMTAVAFLVAGVVVQRDLERKGEPAALAWSVITHGIVGGLLGARLLLLAHYWEDIPTQPELVVRMLVAGGGFVWYGGLVGGVLATAFPIRRYGVPWASAADSASLGIALGYGIGRIGCHLAGDGDWGTPTTLPWGVSYRHAVAGWPPPGLLPTVTVHPTPLYEFAASVLIFVVLWRLRARLRPAGAVFALYLVLAGVERVLIELVRQQDGRPGPQVAGLNEAQLTSLVLVAGAAAWLACRASIVPAGTLERGRAVPL
ncbi:MAG TPA: prolipoprotein diacylglyceryl transferase family protein [Candidatus Binatia bacterium]|nr:prolipoprotein diacylglyceryl transferase family protein [Candidatus Binatia bacterium]